MSTSQCFIKDLNRMNNVNTTDGSDAKPPVAKGKVMSYEEKSVGSTAFFKCEACPYMALAEDDIKFHLFTEHPELAKSNGLADHIQILCPGCTSVFDAEETLRSHLRNHHKMGLKDVKKMVRSLIQIALKNAKLKKHETAEEPQPLLPIQQDVKMPEVIEIIPGAAVSNESLPQGVAFISVDELQKMSTPNFEKVDPKEIIQEASINIVCGNEMNRQYMNVNEPSTSNGACNIIQMSSVPPDLISSIQPRLAPYIDNNAHTSPQAVVTQDSPQTAPKKLKPGRPIGSKSISTYKTDGSISEIDVEKEHGKLCSTNGCHLRLKDENKLLYHRKCHINNQLSCPECFTVLPTVELLHIHLWKSHQIDLELPTCEICGYKTYKRHKLFNTHMKIHGVEKNYPCNICSKTFKNNSQLSKHRWLHKTEAEPISCSVCLMEFKTQRQMKIHKATVHEKLKPFKCSHCQYATVRGVELKRHLRSHTGDKPYSCEECSYRASDHNAFRRHKKIHSKESLYKCKYCSYSSIQSTTFASHMISKHPNVSSNDLHRCPYCPFKTVNKNKYVVHLKTHPDKEGVQLLLEMTKGTPKNSKPSWTIPSENTAEDANKTTEPIDEDTSSEQTAAKHMPTIELYDCDSLQDSIPQTYPKNYSTHLSTKLNSFNEQLIATDFSKDDTNSDCLMSESSNDTLIERQYPPQHLPSVYQPPPTSLHMFTTSATMGQSVHPSTVSLVTCHSPLITKNIMSNFPIRLPPIPQISVRNNITLKPIDKISLIKPTQILPVPSSSNSPVHIVIEPDGGPRKKPKISVKSNLILKGPDEENMFHSQQKMAFKRLEDNERFGLDGNNLVTFNNLMSTPFMQMPPPPALSQTPDAIILPYAQETRLVLEASTPPADPGLTDTAQRFSYQQILPPQTKIQTTDPSYIKLEGTIKQNTQSPSLERMQLNNGAISREYKASPPPPLEEHKNMSEIKNELKSDYYNLPMSTTAPNTPLMDQYLLDNIIGEQYAGNLDLASIAMQALAPAERSDVIEIDDNSDDNKLLPRFDMNFPLESLYLMHNDFHFLENEMAASGAEATVSEMPRMPADVVPLSQKESGDGQESSSGDFPNFIQGKKDPMMNTSVRPSTNKINVKNIELMKN